LLGRNFGNTRFADCSVRERNQTADMLVSELHLINALGDEIPATLLQPRLLSKPGPAILYCHAHGNRYEIGRRELLSGRQALSSPYAHDLVSQGYQVLCVDMPCFGERQHLQESATAKACLWHGDTLFGWMLSELMAAVTYLSNQPMVDAKRIATLGISMGGTHAWWLAALDTRVSASVALCCFADLGCLIEQNLHDGHGIYMSVPNLLSHISTGELAAKTCPRPQLFGIGLQDWSTPRPCFELAQAELTAVYANENAADQLAFHVETQLGHQESPAMREQVLTFLQHHLDET